MMNRTRPIDILLVEDNPADIRLIEEGLNETRIRNVLHPVTSGQQALDFLFRQEDYPDAPRPDLILLDLNLPGISGQEVLTAVKQDEGLRSIPVVVLTSSEAETEIRRAYENHANCFISKPVDFASLIEVVGRIERFWFATVRLPKVA